MTLSKYLICMAAGTLASFGAWALVLWKINPEEAGAVGVIFFYLTLFASLTGVFSLAGFFVRKLIIRNEIDFRHVAVSFRQAIFFSILISGSLFLQSLGLFSWLNVILMLFVLTILEFFFISYKRPQTV